MGYRKFAVLALVGLAAAGCSSSNDGSGGTTGSTGSTGSSGSSDIFSRLGVPVPDNVTVGSEFEQRLTDFSDTLLAVLPTDPSAPLDPVALPASGSATYTGFGMIVDINAPDTVTYDDFVNDTYALIASEASASIDFGGMSISTAQGNFIKADGSSVPGSLSMTGGTITASGGFATYTGTVNGSVNGTAVSGPENGFFYGPNGEVAFGVWQDVGSGGVYDGGNLVGAYAVD